MIIRPATLSDEKKVLEIVDEFNDYANSLNSNSTKESSTFSRDNSGKLFREIIESSASNLLMALDGQIIVGFLEIHKVPRLRKANYYGEIECMFVKESYRGEGTAIELMKEAIEWAKQEKLDCIRLYSGHELKRAHAFYEKMGFVHAGKTYKFDLTSR